MGPRFGWFHILRMNRGEGWIRDRLVGLLKGLTTFLGW